MDDIHPLILKRWSPVAFDSKPVGQGKINLLFEAAKWAPSGRNAQPWRFLYATREMPDYESYLNLMDKGNQVWARTAPLFILALAQVISTYKDRPNRLALYEAGMAVSNLLLQATHLGLFVHQMAGYDTMRAREILAIPQRYEPTAMMAVGYKGDPAVLPPDVASREERERTRMKISEFVITGKFRT
jgi:nitroreductase